MTNPSQQALTLAVREVLQWYATQVAGCRKISRDGDSFRSLLDNDGGARARIGLATLDRIEAFASPPAVTAAEPVALPKEAASVIEEASTVIGKLSEELCEELQVREWLADELHGLALMLEAAMRARNAAPVETPAATPTAQITSGGNPMTAFEAALIETLETINSLVCYASEEDTSSQAAVLLEVGKHARAALLPPADATLSTQVLDDSKWKFQGNDVVSVERRAATPTAQVLSDAVKNAALRLTVAVNPCDYWNCEDDIRLVANTLLAAATTAEGEPTK